MLKYGATAMSYCPILDNKVANYKIADAGNFKKLVIKYIKDKKRMGCFIPTLVDVKVGNEELKVR